MFIDCFLSSALLTIGSISSLYILLNNSYERFRTIRPELIPHILGVGTICLNSSLDVILPIASSRSFPIDPFEIEEESRNEAKARLWPKKTTFCRALSMASINCAAFLANKRIISGIIVVSTILSLESLCVFSEKTFSVFWIFGGLLLNGDSNFFFYAHLPYAASYLVMTPEDDRPWSTKRIVNNYSLLAFVVLTSEALKESEMSLATNLR